MRKLSIIWLCALVFGLLTGPALAIEYCKDFLEDGNPGGSGTNLKTFDEEYTIDVGTSVEVDIWLNDTPESMLTAGFWIIYDSTEVSIVSVEAYDGSDLPGPWDPGMTLKIPDADGPGTHFCALGNFACVAPDGDGDIILGKVRFQGQSPGDTDITIQPIPGFDTVVACSFPTVIYDSGITSNTITIHQVEVPPCKVTVTPKVKSVFPEESVQFSASESGDCNAPCYTWEITEMGCTGSTIDNNGLYTAGGTTCTDKVTVKDPCNENTSDTAVVNVISSITTTTTTTTFIPPPCPSDAYCNDGRFCNGEERCVEGRCQAGSKPCPDDQLFCNGEESCDEENDGCLSSGDPCNPPLVCDEEDDVCLGCLIDEDCDDELFCNGEETCVDEVCQAGTEPCPDDGLFCNGEESCDEENDGCLSSGDPCEPQDLICDDEGVRCVECLTDDDCDVQEECDEGNGVCVAIPPLPGILVEPDPTFQSRWIPLPVFLSIVGSDTNFDSSSSVTFNPASAVLALPPLVVDEENISIIGLLMPLWLTGSLDSVDVTVITGSEEAPGIFEIELLPFILEE